MSRAREAELSLRWVRLMTMLLRRALVAADTAAGWRSSSRYRLGGAGTGGTIPAPGRVDDDATDLRSRPRSRFDPTGASTEGDERLLDPCLPVARHFNA